MSSSKLATEFETLLNAVCPLLIQYMGQTLENDTKVCESYPPEELKEKLDLELSTEGCGDEIIESFKNCLRYSVRTAHPRFCDKLYVGAEPIGIVSELLTATLNTNMHIYNVAPVFTLMEIKTMEVLGKIFGFEDADGLTCPGGSFSNMLAMIVARNTKMPYIKSEGMKETEKLAVLTSAEAHYSITKSANVLGFGTNNVIKVPTNEFGEMIPAELEKCIKSCKENGRRPFFINCTAGTTVKGAFDPFGPICEIAKKHDIWVHIDGCWGGSVVFSEEHKKLLKNCEMSDSIAWNAHKMSGLPIQCSVLLMKKKGLLQASNALGATYLFHDNQYDLGDKTIQCGRKPDIVKLFMTLKYQGIKGFAERIDTAFKNRDYFVKQVKSKSKLKLVFEPYSLNVCFWYLPEQLEKMTPVEERDKYVTEVTAAIYKKLIQSGEVYIDFSPNANGAKFFRMVINSPHLRESDMDLIVDRIIQFGDEIISKK